MYFEERTKRIDHHVTSGDTHFKEREFPSFGAMPLVCRKFNLERILVIVGFIDGMKESAGMAEQIWTREILKYLVKYAPLKIEADE